MIQHGNFEWALDKTTSSFTYDGPYVHTNNDTMLLNVRNELDINKPMCQKDVDTNTGDCEREGLIFQKSQCYKFMANKCTNGCS